MYHSFLLTKLLHNFITSVMTLNKRASSISSPISLDESAFLQVIKNIVTKCLNPTVHHGNLVQTPTKSIQAYLVRLKSPALDCELSVIN